MWLGRALVCTCVCACVEGMVGLWMFRVSLFCTGGIWISGWLGCGLVHGHDCRRFVPHASEGTHLGLFMICGIRQLAASAACLCGGEQWCLPLNNGPCTTLWVQRPRKSRNLGLYQLQSTARCRHERLAWHRPLLGTVLLLASQLYSTSTSREEVCT